MKNAIIAIIAFSILFLGLGWLLVGQTSPTTTVDLAISPQDHVQGTATASATFVEYSDFQCPACAGYQPYLNQLKNDLKDNLKVVFRHMPLSQIHPNANLAAQASEAASNQNAFWPMHDLLFENQSFWENLEDPTDKFIEYAQTLELDIEKFKSDLNSPETIQKVKDDYQSGVKAGINATPTFFINGEKLQNPGSYQNFLEIIKNKISQ